MRTSALRYGFAPAKAHMSQSQRHVECAESLPHATRVSTECRDISENMSRHAASPTSAHLTRHPMPKSPLHGHAGHANSPLTRTRRTAPRWLEGFSSMPDRPVKKETGQNDSLKRENEKTRKGDHFRDAVFALWCKISSSDQCGTFAGC